MTSTTNVQDGSFADPSPANVKVRFHLTSPLLDPGGNGRKGAWDALF
jgi:hypothetical protein